MGGAFRLCTVQSYFCSPVAVIVAIVVFEFGDPLSRSGPRFPVRLSGITRSAVSKVECIRFSPLPVSWLGAPFARLFPLPPSRAVSAAAGRTPRRPPAPPKKYPFTSSSLRFARS